MTGRTEADRPFGVPRTLVVDVHEGEYFTFMATCADMRGLIVPLNNREELRTVVPRAIRHMYAAQDRRIVTVTPPDDIDRSELSYEVR